MSPTSYQAAPPRVIDSTRLAALLQLSTRWRINSAKGLTCFRLLQNCHYLLNVETFLLHGKSPFPGF